jgi:hypothetical protein
MRKEVQAAISGMIGMLKPGYMPALIRPYIVYNQKDTNHLGKLHAIGAKNADSSFEYSFLIPDAFTMPPHLGFSGE